jgi:hypothetical protein
LLKNGGREEEGECKKEKRRTLEKAQESDRSE